MRFLGFLLASTLVAAQPASAAETIAVGGVPAWVVRGDAAKPLATPVDGAVQLLLLDQQVRIEPNTTTAYSRQLLRINDSAGLAAGNLSFVWRPEVDEVTVHGVRILRGKDVIDVLGGGQTFSVLRREANLESAMLDGVLTANLQPEGLQAGDILDLELSVRSSDPLFAGHPEQSLVVPNAAMAVASLSVEWPASLELTTRVSPTLPQPVIRQRGDLKRLQLVQTGVKAMQPPAGAPLRYSVPPSVDITAFRNWSDIGTLMAPLYAKASAIPASGPLRSEVDKIKLAHSDPAARLQAALDLVQNRVRYVGLLMGQGGYVPADAATTWSRRFGDCKAKTALLLGLLRELGIPAVPVAVNTIAGDAIEGRPPMVSLFNHVLVRAELGGRQLWLDGTRTGDVPVEQLYVPYYHWGLELIPSGGRLVPMVPPVPTAPLTEFLIDFDASAGLTLPAKARISAIFRGPAAAEINSLLSQAPAAQRDQLLRAFWQDRYGFVKPATVSSSMDPRTAELRLSLEGTADMDWEGGRYEADVFVGRRLEIDRTAGPFATAPVANPFPSFERTRQTIRLPAEFARAAPQQFPSVSVTLAGTEYRRTASLSGTLFTAEASERTIAPEVPFAEAQRAREQLRSLLDESVYLQAPAGYRAGTKEIDQLSRLPLTAESELVERGSKLLDAGRISEAIKDFDAAVASNPRSAWALANRGLARAWNDESAAAEKDFAAARAIDPRNPVLLRGQGLLAFRGKDWNGAIDYLGQSLAVDPGNDFAHGFRASAYRALGEYDKAIAEAGLALASNPDFWGMRSLRGELLALRGDRSGAAAELASLSGPNASAGELGLAARLARQLGRYDEMLALYDRAMTLEPQPRALLVRALARPESDIEGRRSDLQAYLKKEPNSPEAISALGELMERTGDRSGAVDLYSRGIAALSESYRLRVRRAIALRQLGRSAEAAKDLRASLPPSPTARDYNNRCWALATAGIELEMALADCNQALKRKPGEGAYLDSRALVQFRLNKLDEAIADSSAAIADGLFASSFYVRSLARGRKGDAAGAAQDRTAALALDPDVERRFETYGITR